MTYPLLTLTTDFGLRSPYVAAMKGVVLSINPAARIVDLSHGIPPQDLLYCSFFLKNALGFFPPGTIHVVVVDPGVGTARALLCVEAAGHLMLVPDNGCWTEWAALAPSPPRVWQLTEKRLWRSEVSATFHGRDILAPVAARLSLGAPPSELGTPVESYVQLALPTPRLTPERWEGEVLFVDDFGNLLTNLPGAELFIKSKQIANIHIAGRLVTRWVRAYDEAERGTLVASISSGGHLEIAEVQGDAARRLGAAPGTPVVVEFEGGGTPERTRLE
jgi:S-adenosyl-L-methionine hydrolase (adenosine-forming)